MTRSLGRTVFLNHCKCNTLGISTGLAAALLFFTVIASRETKTLQESQGYEGIMWIVYFLVSAVFLLLMMSLMPAPPARR